SAAGTAPCGSRTNRRRGVTFSFAGLIAGLTKGPLAGLNYSFAHELGHTMGGGHQDAKFGYLISSRAWFGTFRDKEAHTVMSTTPTIRTFNCTGLPLTDHRVALASPPQLGHDRIQPPDDLVVPLRFRRRLP